MNTEHSLLFVIGGLILLIWLITLSQCERDRVRGEQENEKFRIEHLQKP